MDGFAIGAAFQIGTGVGIVVAIAVIAHDFADGFNTYTITSLYGNDKRRAITLLVADAVAPVVGASLTLLISIPPTALGLYLGAFAGFLLYLAVSDILPEAHASHPTLLTVVCTLLGVLGMWVVGQQGIRRSAEVGRATGVAFVVTHGPHLVSPQEG